MRSRPSWFLAASVAGLASLPLVAQDLGDSGTFRSAVELIHVTATVTDGDGRFVPDLTRDDFTVFEDGARQEISYFESERVPVSLGILLDVSGSMTGEKMSSARNAVERFVFDLLGPDDELFFMQFSTRPLLLQEWTHDKTDIARALRRVNPSGGTAVYDAIAEALPLAAAGGNRKKALLVISDGNDTNSRLSPGELRQMIRETEVLVYALGVDGAAPMRVRPSPPRRNPLPFPFPTPGRPGGWRIPLPFPQIVGGGPRQWPGSLGSRVDGGALRQITDDTGGRTEIVRGIDDLGGATARIADELSRQYALGYVSTGQRDGRWHSIRVSVRDGRLTVRARRGYLAS